MPSSPLIPLNSRFFKRPIAHRGLHNRERVENSLESFSAAMDQGFPIELDVQFSQDDEPMVFHDDHLERLTGVNLDIQKASSAQLSDIPLINGARIPHLRDVLSLVNNAVPLVIEIKFGPAIFSHHSEKSWKNLYNLLSQYQGDFVLMSFNHKAIDVMKSHFPQTPIGLVRADFTLQNFPSLMPSALARLDNEQNQRPQNWDFESWKWTDLPPYPSSTPRFSWTIRSEKEAEMARKLSDNITFEGYIPQ